MSLHLDRALTSDVNDLLALYATIYGRDYPLAVGNDARVMRTAIENPAHLWIVVRDDGDKSIAASIYCEVDAIHQIGRIQAMVVHPKYRGLHLASKMIGEIVRRTLGPEGNLKSVYATTRTVSMGPQAAFLNQGFLPLGILPNAHCLKNYETLTLMARFREGILQNRAAVPAVPAKLLPIIRAYRGITGETAQDPQISDPAQFRRGKEVHEFEFIWAPDFVRRRFNETFADPYDRFYPFHEPNLLIAAKGGGPEIYAYFNSVDGYCTFVSNNVPLWEMAASLDNLFSSLEKFGAAYIEILIGVGYRDSLAVLLENQFMPSAIYPAMRGTEDFFVLSRTAEPLSFRKVLIDRRFKPYVDQLVQSWTQTYVEAVEIIDEAN